MVWSSLKNGALSETLNLKRSPKKIYPIKVPIIKYRVLNGENLTTENGLSNQIRHIQI